MGCSREKKGVDPRKKRGRDINLPTLFPPPLPPPPLFLQAARGRNFPDLKGSLKKGPPSGWKGGG